jgi:hypothetical protein
MGNGSGLRFFCPIFGFVMEYMSVGFLVLGNLERCEIQIRFHQDSGQKLILYYVSHNTSSLVGHMNNYILKNRNFSTIPVRYFFIDGPQYGGLVPTLIVPREAWDVSRLVPRKGNLGTLYKHPTSRKDIDIMVKDFLCANYYFTIYFTITQ